VDKDSLSLVEQAKRPLLLLSGGKDSMACYYLLKDFWDKLLVVFINTGDAFPETLKIIEEVKKVHPLFLEVKSDVKKFREEFGNPFDVVVMNNTRAGIDAGSEEVAQKQCLPFACCSKNLWEPTQNVLTNLKPDVVIRGERKSEDLKSLVTPGYVENDVIHVLPIYEWSDKDVLSYLESVGFDLPLHYFFKESSLDCMGCTAYSEHTNDRMSWMAKNHPLQFEINKRMKLLNLKIVKQKTRALEKVLDAR
jgi:3'-phosphoadenosine 5'-phosphosulfate sulfotransferase (PAPS reductase)/FAD synthetase